MLNMKNRKFTALLGVLLFVMPLFVSCIPEPEETPSNVSAVKLWYTGTRAAGTTMQLDFIIGNNGPVNAKGLTGTLTSTSTYVTIVSGTHYYGDLSSGYYKSCSDYVTNNFDEINAYTKVEPKNGFTIKIKNAAPKGITIPIEIKLTDVSGNTFTTTFKIEVSASSDTPDADDETTEDDTTTGTGTITSAYWGSWIQMDTGTEYYIDSSYIWQSTETTLKSKKIQTGISGYTLEGTTVMKKGTTRYFRKGGGSRSFTLNTSGFVDSSARGIDLGTQKVVGRRSNKNNSSDKETKQTDSDGKLKFTGAVAGDTQKVVVSVVSKTDDDTTTSSSGDTSSKTDDIEINVTPNYDGENLGTIPLVEKGSYGFKTSYTISGNTDAQGFLYGNSAQIYTVSFTLKNIGSVDCSASSYQVSCDDSLLTLGGTELKGNFSTIEANNSSKAKSFTVSYGKVDKEYVDVPVKITITDSKYMKTWEDYITLRFYKGLVELNVKAYHPEEKSGTKLNGFLIYPDGRSKRFQITHNTQSSPITVPWSEKDYILAFSGADATSEMRFSCGFVNYNTLPDLAGYWEASEMGAYSDATTVDKAYSITDLKTPIKAYLGKGDVKYFKVNSKNLTTTTNTPIECYSQVAVDTSTNNVDGKISPGETFLVDLKLYNKSAAAATVTCGLSSKSKYVEVSTAAKSFGTISSKYYKTFYNAQTASNKGYSTYSSSNYSSTYSTTYYPFTFKVSQDCPIGTEIVFAVTYKLSTGLSWTEDVFKCKVEKPVQQVEVISKAITDSSSLYGNNNGDGKVNAGEKIFMDLKLRNKASATLSNVTCDLSSESKYVTVNNSSINFGSIGSTYYKTYYDYKGKSSSSGYSSSTSSAFSSTYSTTYYPFSFTVSADCPADTVLPFKISYKGNEIAEFSYTVVKNTLPTSGITATITDTSNLSEAVTLSYTYDETTNKYTFTAAATGVSTYSWYIDNVKQSGTTATFIVNPSSSNVTAGVHNIQVRIVKNSVTYSAQKQIVIIKQKTPDDYSSNSSLLTNGTWVTGEITSDNPSKKYTINVTSGNTYYVYWDDSYNGSGTYTCDVYVSAAYSSGTTIFSSVDSAYSTAKSFTATQTDTVNITVTPYQNGTGTFRIKYSY